MERICILEVDNAISRLIWKFIEIIVKQQLRQNTFISLSSNFSSTLYRKLETQETTHIQRIVINCQFFLHLLKKATSPKIDQCHLPAYIWSYRALRVVR